MILQALIILLQLVKFHTCLYIMCSKDFWALVMLEIGQNVILHLHHGIASLQCSSSCLLTFKIHYQHFSGLFCIVIVHMSVYGDKHCIKGDDKLIYIFSI